ncbi:Type I restriction enzyme R protein HsdR [Helicobacter sp. NHP21005]|uniref:type I restriction endonuclease subunit R, EcoR124 family n=1 Tax=Helicobacter felistomachi TaxID=3040201 RepID=UPI002573C15A|nr:HsdR family type I site-specific deoxyribonuclease [Helicobacter sp. NHP21005]BEG57251.1 Type I restriction enzyme R protein HsdR [Helicobacter sp. NHP21005]
MTEEEFEEQFVQELQKYGWDAPLELPTHQDLLKNWQKILNEQNPTNLPNQKPLDLLEAQELLRQLEGKSPFEIHNVLEGGSLKHLARDKHFKIFDTTRGLGNIRYQIARQPWFGDKWEKSKKRGDISLLIHGLPLVHIELKKEGVSLSAAFKQIKDYAKEGAFRGLFSCIQLFVCATPKEAVYFPNFGRAENFNEKFCLKWADLQNQELNDYKSLIKNFLSVDFIHTFISRYLVADNNNQSLKAMRPYQCYAVQALLKSVQETQGNKGGFVWHTTGSGKTLTSFKSAILLLQEKLAKKVVFLADRRELVLQTLGEYQNADTKKIVQDTTKMAAKELKNKLKEHGEGVFVATLQTMCKITPDRALEKQKFIFIVDEAHRSTFGNVNNKENDSLGMLKTIQENFKNALFIGFTGTPKTDKASKLKTEDIFGKELHRYTLKHGIKDKTVLGFDVDFINTMPNLREDIARMKAEKKAQKAGRGAYEIEYQKWMDKAQTPHTKLEAEIPPEMFNEGHKNQVIDYILKHHDRLSNEGEFHALFATSSIPDALEYYKLFKERGHGYKITAVFDPNENATNENATLNKRADIEEILGDYNRHFKHSFGFENYKAFQKDVAQRLSHKKCYAFLPREECLDLVIVVDQMLTGFDSNWVNTLYLDKVLEGANLIQAISRTNRLYGENKPFGNIAILRKYATMKENLKKAVAEYADGEGVEILARKLPQKVQEINELHKDISTLLEQDQDLEDSNHQRAFIKLFNKLHATTKSAQIQGLNWGQKDYCLSPEEQSLLDKPQKAVRLKLDEESFKIYGQKYKDIAAYFEKRKREKGEEDIGFEFDYGLVEQDEGMRIDYEKITDWLKEKNQEKLERHLQTLDAKTRVEFQAFLENLPKNWEEIGLEKCYMQFLQAQQEKEINAVVQALGVDRELLKECMADGALEIKKFKKLVQSANEAQAKAYFEKQENKALTPNDVYLKTFECLKHFLTNP